MRILDHTKKHNKSLCEESRDPVHVATAMPVCVKKTFFNALLLTSFRVQPWISILLMRKLYCCVWEWILVQQMKLEHQRLVQFCLVLHRFAPLHHNLKQSLRGEIQHHILSTNVQSIQSIIRQADHPQIGTVQ